MTLARAFAAELESGATEFHALVGNFILCAILGKKPMLGDPIKSEQVRMTAAIFAEADAVRDRGSPTSSRFGCRRRQRPPRTWRRSTKS